MRTRLRPCRYGRYFRGAVAEVLVYPRALNASELAATQAYFAAAHPAMPAPACVPPPGDGFCVGSMCARCAGFTASAFELIRFDLV